MHLQDDYAVTDVTDQVDQIWKNRTARKKLVRADAKSSERRGLPVSARRAGLY
jgi:hypothetical protein